jgi:Ferric reductase like transmembrane component
MNGALPWYVARAAGLVSWGLLTAATMWGLALSTKLFGRRPRPSWILDLHRMLGGLALVFTGVHVGAILVDTYVHFGLTDVLVPFAAKWHPVAVAWGVVALYLLAAVELTSLLRARLPRVLWRRVHYASFPLFVLATVHGLTAGTDTTRRVALLVAAASGLAVLVLLVMRTLPHLFPEPAPTRARVEITREPEPVSR